MVTFTECDKDLGVFAKSSIGQEHNEVAKSCTVVTEKVFRR